MVDHLAIEGATGLMIDYKFGANRVDDPSENIQFQDYSVKAFDRFPELETLTVALIAPRRDEVFSHVYTRESIAALRTRCAMVRARAGTGQRNASPMCQYCNRLGVCDTAYDTFAKTSHEGELLPAIKPGLDLTNAQDLVKALDIRPVVKKYIEHWDKAVTDAAKELLGEGVEVPGYELGSNRGRSKVANPETVRKCAFELGVTEAEFAECSEVSLSKVVNMVRDHAPYRKKQIYAQNFKRQCGEAIEAGAPYDVVRKKK